MPGIDLVLKIIALGAFVAFLSVLAIYVPEWNLLTLLFLVVAMAAYDFFRWPSKRNGQDPDARRDRA